jgi:PucR C-terminal helix-turn-helix domain
MAVRDQVLQELLLDRWDQGLLRRALQAKHDVRLPHGVMVACAPALEAAHATLRTVAARVHHAFSMQVPCAVPPHAVLLLPVATPAIWTHALDTARAEAEPNQAVVVVRPPVTGLRALRAAYHRTVADASLALAGGPRGPLVTPEELVVPRMLSLLDEADQQALMAPLRPILAQPPAHRRAYLRTLDVLRRTGGTHADAAEALHLHVNSVRYRIDRIEDMTGLRLSNPEQRLALDLAAMLVALRDGPPALVAAIDSSSGTMDDLDLLRLPRPAAPPRPPRRRRPRPRGWPAGVAPQPYVARLVPRDAAA